MAIVLEVWVNGERKALAGEQSLSVLGAHVSAVGKLGSESLGTKRRIEGDADLDVYVGGLTRRGRGRMDEHLRWGPRLKLKPGDEVTIRVLQSEVFDPPTERYPSERVPGSAAARKRWLDARSLYLRLRPRFEPAAERRDARRRRRYMKHA